LPQRLGATGANALFVAKRLVKNNVLVAGLDFDAAVHGQDGNQGGIDFQRINHPLFGTQFQHGPSAGGDRRILRLGEGEHAAQEHGYQRPGATGGSGKCLEGTAQQLQDGLQGCESFDVLASCLHPMQI